MFSRYHVKIHPPSAHRLLHDRWAHWAIALLEIFFRSTRPRRRPPHRKPPSFTPNLEIYKPWKTPISPNLPSVENLHWSCAAQNTRNVGTARQRRSFTRRDSDSANPEVRLTPSRTKHVHQKRQRCQKSRNLLNPLFSRSNN